MPLDALMREADFVVVCCLLNDETRHLIDARKFALMKPQRLLHQYGARPDPRREGAGGRARGGRIAGAGLDVTEREPIEPDSPCSAWRT